MFLRNVKCKAMLTEAYLSSAFYLIHPFVKKLTTVKLWKKNAFVNNRTIFFLKIQNYV